jgi:Na+/H+ antiporter NhaD/arsenite permease-like protein
VRGDFAAEDPVTISLATLAVVLFLIAVRRIGSLRIAIWQAMAGGAFLVLAAGEVTPVEAARAIDLDVMVFLLGMFLVGQALTESGYLYALAYDLFCRLHSADALVAAILVVAGLASALLMNDTLAVVGTALVLRLAREHRLDNRLLLMALAFGVTTGSVMSPIGNPQNLLVATRGPVEAPFVAFLTALGPPTLVALGLAFVVLRVGFRDAFHDSPLIHAPVTVKDPALGRLARLSLVLLAMAIGARIVLTGFGAETSVPLAAIAVVGALPLLFSPRRWRLLRHVDWPTLAFFAAMFVLMDSVWRNGLAELAETVGLDELSTLPAVLGVSALASQVVSNVPLVALYLPVLGLHGASEPLLMALAAGSTIAGNLLIIGAASNVIIVQGAERNGAHLSFWDFARVGIPLTLLQLPVYLLYLLCVY